VTQALVATDLDGTVLFSDRAMGAERPDPARLRPVDTDGRRTYAYMTDTAVQRWTALVATGALVPATTRSVEQYLRLRLPGPAPRYAVVCNGARILVDGASDPRWETAVRQRLGTEAVGFGEVWEQAVRWHAAHGFAAVRAVEDFFVYLTVSTRDERFVSVAREASRWSRERGWRASLQGRKLYLLPRTLDKAPAVAELAARLGTDRLFAGGDSLLDERMLRAADAAIRPAHGELHVTGFAAPHCRTTAGRGADAGDEILDWYTEQLAAGCHPDAPRAGQAL
jgi:hydroxymethylpyrimidine pyrophosphatase-like HAD family hydrolase